MPILLSAVPDCIAWILFFRSSNSSSSTLLTPSLVGLDASELLRAPTVYVEKLQIVDTRKIPVA